VWGSRIKPFRYECVTLFSNYIYPIASIIPLFVHEEGCDVCATDDEDSPSSQKVYIY
jgi:hypothetical protein